MNRRKEKQFEHLFAAGYGRGQTNPQVELSSEETTEAGKVKSPATKVDLKAAYLQPKTVLTPADMCEPILVPAKKVNLVAAETREIYRPPHDQGQHPITHDSAP